VPYLFVLISVILFSLAVIMQNRAVKAGSDFLGVIIINNLPLGALMTAWCICFCNLSSISLPNWLLILTTGALWSVAAFFRTKSYQDIDTSVARIFNTMRFVFLVFCGFFIFKEKITLFNITGIICTITAILSTVDYESITSTRGAKYCFISAFFGAAAVVITKHLATAVPFELVVASDFFLPGLFIYFAAPNARQKTLSTIDFGRKWILLAPFLSITGYYFRIAAFSMGGELVIVSILAQTGLIVVLAVEYFFINVIANFQRRCLAGGLCTLGAILATAF
jgi:drug/metabolite transporter (DMT)-like permease